MRRADIEMGGGANGPRREGENRNALLLGSPRHCLSVPQVAGQPKEYDVCLHCCHVDFRLRLSDKFCARSRGPRPGAPCLGPARAGQRLREFRIAALRRRASFGRVGRCADAKPVEATYRRPYSSPSCRRLFGPWLRHHKNDCRLSLAGWDFHPLESAALSRRTPAAATICRHWLRARSAKAIIGRR